MMLQAIIELIMLTSYACLLAHVSVSLPSMFYICILFSVKKIVSRSSHFEFHVQ